jgi:DNA-binding NtrC family response regulator
MQVLIADGDEAFLEVAQCHLSHHGHEAKVASNGLECFNLLQRELPDAVVLQRELLWGGSDGVQALMHQDPRWSEIPVILISNDDLPEESHSVSSRRLVAQLQKLHRLEDLLEACSRACVPNRA